MNNQSDGVTLLDDEAREGIALILDAILPGTKALPSGRAIGAHHELLDRVLHADSTLALPVTAGGRRAAQAGSCALADLQRWAGPDAERVVFALHSAYYMSSDVRAALGYPGQTRRPIALATPDEVVSDDLVAPVIERGSIYVPTPG